MLIDIVYGQDLGTKDKQEDFIEIKSFSDKEKLIVLADGMGGYKGGEIASRIVVQTFIEEFTKSDRRDISVSLKTALYSANEVLLEEKEKDYELEDMGTTLVAVYIKENFMQWLSVGDSPFWIFRSGKLIRLNEIHSYATVLEKRWKDGKITKEEFEEHPDRHTLTSAIVGETINKVEISKKYKIKDKDILLIASDGVETLEEDELVEILRGETKLSIDTFSTKSILKIKDTILERIQVIYKYSRTSGSTKVLERYQDNTSIVLVQFEEEKDKKDFWNDLKFFSNKYPFHVGVILLSIIFSYLIFWNSITGKIENNETTKTENNVSSKAENNEIVKIENNVSSKAENNEITKTKNNVSSKTENNETTKTKNIELNATLENSKITFNQEVNVTGMKIFDNNVYIYGKYLDKGYCVILDSNLSKLKSIKLLSSPPLDIAIVGDFLFSLNDKNIYRDGAEIINDRNSKHNNTKFITMYNKVFVYKSDNSLYKLFDKTKPYLEEVDSNEIKSINPENFYNVSNNEYINIENNKKICIHKEEKQYCYSKFKRQKSITYIGKDEKDYFFLIEYSNEIYIVYLDVSNEKLSKQKSIKLDKEEYGKKGKYEFILGNKFVRLYEENYSVVFKELLELNTSN